MRDLATPGGAAGIWVPDRSECMVTLSWQKEKAWAGVSSLQLLGGWSVTALLHCSFFLSYGKRGRRTSGWITLSSTRVFLSHSFSYIFILAAAYQAGLRHLGLT